MIVSDETQELFDLLEALNTRLPHNPGWTHVRSRLTKVHVVIQHQTDNKFTLSNRQVLLFSSRTIVKVLEQLAEAGVAGEFEAATLEALVATQPEESKCLPDASAPRDASGEFNAFIAHGGMDVNFPYRVAGYKDGDLTVYLNWDKNVAVISFKNRGDWASFKDIHFSKNSKTSRAAQ